MVRASARSVMVVGTSSDSGKSYVAAGLCRILARRGFRVAPFKAQNMSLNSYVTSEGGEMGRAQVVQAIACGLAPHTDMNPVLLKPQGDSGSQVIVDGAAIGVLKAGQFYEQKPRMRGAAHAAFDRLAAKYDYVVLEGAGSPAEINMLKDDYVNMDMAAYAGARTVLVADIDRGGVFAMIYGTIQLLPPELRTLIKGVIINKFRGDSALLEPGIKDIERLTGVPVLGVLPYLRDIKIDDEDSVAIENRHLSADTAIDVAVIRLPHISNFTDFMAMEHDEGVGLRYVENVSDLGAPDLIVIPGTKNTRGDLEWLQRSGWRAAIAQAHSQGVPVFGICGGYQMLGRSVSDPLGVEGPAGETAGLGLLPLKTEFMKVKELAQVEGRVGAVLPFAGEGCRFWGYEIHAGRTTVEKDGPSPLLIENRNGCAVREPAGAVSGDGLVFGCYPHGFFDSHEIRSGLWRWLCERKGIDGDAVRAGEYTALKELDRIADSLEASLNLESILASC